MNQKEKKYSPIEVLEFVEKASGKKIIDLPFSELREYTERLYRKKMRIVSHPERLISHEEIEKDMDRILGEKDAKERS